MTAPADRLANKKVAYYTGCFANYYYPEPGQAMVEVLHRNGVEVIVPDQVCCGLPMMAKGNIKGAYRNIQKNMLKFAEPIDKGYVVITGCPSCSLFLKRDYALLSGSQQGELMARYTYHFSHYLLELSKMGQLNREFRPLNQNVFYHTPCHLRAQETDSPTVGLLRLVPGLTILHISSECCGMGGAYGYEKANYRRSKEIGDKLFSEIDMHPADRIVTDCGGCKLQIEAATGASVDHPIVLIREAYGL